MPVQSFDETLGSIGTWVDEQVVAGAAAAVWHRGELVAAREAGDARSGEPVTAETLFALASVSKPVTAAVVLRQVEAGTLDLDGFVVDVLPEFAVTDDPFADDAYPQLEALRDQVTIRQLLCHTSGLPENIGAKRVRMRDQPSLETLTDLMCKLPLQSAPGETLRYSNAGYGVTARVAETASGASFPDLLKETVLDPLDVTDLVLRPGPEVEERRAHTTDAAPTVTSAKSYDSAYWRALGIPWGGMYGTTRAALTFAAAFLPGSRRLFSEETVVAMTTDQTGGVPGGVESFGAIWRVGRWGAGWEVKGEKTNHWTGNLTSPRTFCHWGASGTLVWADPERDLALAVFANRTVRQPWPMRPPRWASLSDAVVTASDRL
jgi:CubicO group peptidase (beta-lactamase class C family)